MSSQESGQVEQPKEVCNLTFLGGGPSISELEQDGFFENKKPGKFVIDSVSEIYVMYPTPSILQLFWDKEALETLLEKFSYFQEKGIVWERLEIFVIDNDNERFIRPLLRAVNTLKIFKSIKLNMDFHDYYYEEDSDYLYCRDVPNVEEEDESSEAYSDFCPGMTSNTFTEEVEICCSGEMSWARYVALDNLLQANVPSLQHLILSCTVPHLSYPGLSNNKTLKTLGLKLDVLDSSNMTDFSTSEMIAAIARNPNLEFFGVEFGSGWFVGDLSSEAFKRFLSVSTSLKELRVTSTDGKAKLGVECIIQGLKNSRSLKKLDIRDMLYGDLIFARLFQILPDCPLIDGLMLSIDVFSKKDMAQVKVLPRLQRPVRLVVEDIDDVFSNFVLKALADMLRYHPELLLSLRDEKNEIIDETHKKYKGKAEFWHNVNMNWHGRYLLDRPNVPISIWPLILEKVNDSVHVKDNASIIYEHLKGLTSLKSTIL